jgi:hypothetical protein
MLEIQKVRASFKRKTAHTFALDALEASVAALCAEISDEPEISGGIRLLRSSKTGAPKLVFSSVALSWRVLSWRNQDSESSVSATTVQQTRTAVEIAMVDFDGRSSAVARPPSPALASNPISNAVRMMTTRRTNALHKGPNPAPSNQTCSVDTRDVNRTLQERSKPGSFLRRSQKLRPQCNSSSPSTTDKAGSISGTRLCLGDRSRTVP